MLRIIVSLVVFGVAIASAQASTLSYTSYSVINPQTVTLSGDALGHQENAGAGEIILQGINGGTGVLSTFCVDIADWLTQSGQFSAGTYLTGPFGDQVNALLTHVLPTLGTDVAASAALQVAIWKSEYGTGLTVSGNNDVTTLADGYIGNLRSGLWAADGSMRVAVLDGGGKDQSQAYLARVSEPASLAVLGMALMGAAVWRSGRRAIPGGYSRLATQSINCRPRQRPLN